MRKVIYLICALMCFNFASEAAAGDTTRVQAHYDVQMPGYGSYDTTITFPAPGTTYRKIYMVFTLGKYVCPGSPTYCGDWDYTVDNYLMTPGGDTLDLGRLITPYANAGAPRTPWTWKQHYVYDVTDYAGVLHGPATMRTAYSGYSGGFTTNIQFIFIEGTPDRDVISVNRLWHGYRTYGDTTHHDSNNINVFLPYQNFTAPTGTQAAELKYVVSGHGSDVNQCCEFMPHTYSVFLNSAKVDSYYIWRSDCGRNELSPQSGTWIYERGNWCPGNMVYPNFHKLPGVTAGGPVNVDIQFEPYIGNGGGGYGFEGALFFYKGMNKTLDASIDWIIAPTNDENFFRENPICGSPKIHVKNTGATAITSITFHYGVSGYSMIDYTWSGSLASLQGADITLPLLPELSTLAGTSGNYTFVSTITAVNGTADDDATNNTMTSQFVMAPVWPTPFRIVFRANHAVIAPGSTTSETSWAIYDVNNTVVAQRVGATRDSLYIDTVILPAGLYKLAISDSGCDGLYWWANAAAGSGFISVKQYATNINIPMHGYNYTGTYNNDFGCGFTQYFYTGDQFVGVNNVAVGAMGIEAYPNPAKDVVRVELSGAQHIDGAIQLIDALSRVVSETPCNSANTNINVTGFSSGAYTLRFTDKVHPENKLITRLVISN